MSNTPSHGLVILADDDEAWRCLTANSLRNRGIRVQEATNGAELLFQLQVLRLYGEFPVVVSDLHMPGGSGLEAAQAARIAAPDVPFVLITGSSDPTLLSRARASGATLLSKPILPSELACVVQRLARPT